MERRGWKRTKSGREAKVEEREARREREGVWKGALRAVEGETESAGVRREGETEKGVGDGAKGTEGRETRKMDAERVVDVIEKGEKEG